MEPSRDVARLVEIMRALRDPHTGCPWDIEQTVDTIVPYTIEETFEVVDAIERRDPEDFREELGDLLLQVVYYAQLAEEENLFGFEDVVETITAKMIRRHPHVFGDTAARDARSAKGQWERIKREEKAERAARRAARQSERPADDEWIPAERSENPGLLDDVPGALPALALSLKLQAKAATVGFDWTEVPPIVDKLKEEIAEFENAVATGSRTDQRDEIGDLLFCVVNLARRTEIDPETALRGTTMKFRRRFAAIEAAVSASGKTLAETSLADMEALWQAAKRLRDIVDRDAAGPDDR